MMRKTALLAVLSIIGASTPPAAGGQWTFDTEDRGHPQLMYAENGKRVFMVGCGHAFAIHAVYPGARHKDESKAAIVISNGKREMRFAGEIDGGYSDDDPPNTTHFVQWDLGYKRQNPGLYGKTWKALEAKLFDLLDAGRPLTVSAEGKSYVLPPIDVPRWKARFKDIC